MKKSLIEIWDDLNKQGLGCDKNTIHSYVPVYEKIFAPYRHTAKNILEIGIFKGDSLLMFEEFFDGKVGGIDCSETPHDGMGDLRPLIKQGTHNIFILDAENEMDVFNAFHHVKFDIIIEDAGHHIEQQIKLYSIFKNHLSKGATYVVEDVQDIDSTRHLFENIDSEKEITILDRRHINGRYDDVLVIITDKK